MMMIYAHTSVHDAQGARHACPADKAPKQVVVFFAGSDGTPASPGHVGLVIGGGMMIEGEALSISPARGPRWPATVPRPSVRDLALCRPLCDLVGAAEPESG